MEMTLSDPRLTAGRESPFSETLVNKRAVAAFLGMTESGFTKMIKRGEGPPYLRIGRLIRFSPHVVKAWVKAQVEITESAVTEPRTINS